MRKKAVLTTKRTKLNSGNYTLSISLINSFGDSADYDLPVHIIGKSYRGMQIHLNEDLIYINTGTTFDPEGYVKEVVFYQTEELVPRKDWGLKIKSNVDTSKAGVYEVRYMITKDRDADYGSASGVTWMTVIVAD